MNAATIAPDFAPASRPPRLTSLDQFRGYTMFGMLLVNFLGSYAVCPRILRHTHDYCSYADTIMPHFLFAVGFAMRLSLGRRMEAGGRMPWGRAVRRILGLALVAVVWYSYGSLQGILRDFQTQDAGLVLYGLIKRQWFQTLMHIAVTSLWILPVIIAPVRIRILYAVGSGLLHLVLSWWFNFAWTNGDSSVINGGPLSFLKWWIPSLTSDSNAIDGGPLGFLTWSIPALCGTFAYDFVRASGVAATGRIALLGVAIMVLGWGFSFPTVLYNVPAEQDEALKAEKLAPDPVLPTMDRIRSWDGSMVELPFVPPPERDHRKWNYWMMTQRAGSLSYLTFSAGFSLLVYAGFLWACDGRGWGLGLFRTFGTNSLAAYILHDLAGGYIKPYFPGKTSSALEAGLAFGLFTLVVYLCCRFLEWRKWYIRV